MSIMDKDDLPKWQRIKYDIELQIITGEYQSGEIVPSVRTLAKLYKVGTSTSHIILEKLADEGTLIMEQGVGFRVNGRAIKRLRVEHKKRLTSILKQACEYADTIHVDPVELVTDIFASRHGSEKKSD